MTPVTKTTYIDNWSSEIPNTVEIGVGKKRAFVEHKTGRLINRDNISRIEQYQAYKIGKQIALDYKNKRSISC